MRFVFLFLTFVITQIPGRTQNVTYPYTVHYLSLMLEGQPANMAYMDVPAAKPNGKTILLLHGKNFNGYYWKDQVAAFNNAGFRVIVPDQVGWGKSGKPRVHYSFHGLAGNTKKLLDTLAISRVYLIGHSMGGMLAARFTLMYPGTVQKLVLENPIGLEDYKTFVPYQDVHTLHRRELAGTYASYKKYQQTYYPTWKPEYEQYVQAQAASLNDTNFNQTALVNALTYQMIYEQPVVYELHRIKTPTLLVIGQEDRTVVGKDQLRKEEVARYGNYPMLGRATRQKIPGSRLLPLPGVGHIPHIEAPREFSGAVIAFFNQH